MTGSTVLDMLFGASLVMVGVLTIALADRIRGLRVTRDRAASHSPHASHATAPVRPPIEVVEAELVPSAPVAPPKSRRQQYIARVASGESPSQVKMDQDADEVIAALVTAGYKKAVVVEAVWNCGAAERATVPGWTAAALRRCGRGGLS